MPKTSTAVVKISPPISQISPAFMIAGASDLGNLTCQNPVSIVILERFGSPHRLFSNRFLWQVAQSRYGRQAKRLELIRRSRKRDLWHLVFLLQLAGLLVFNQSQQVALSPVY